MQKLIIWYLDKFIPWFVGISRYIGILAIYYSISYFLNYFLNLNSVDTFVTLIIFGFLLKYWAEDGRLNRRIKELMEIERDNILRIIKEDKHEINYEVLYGVEAIISQNLYENNFYNDDNKHEIN